MDSEWNKIQEHNHQNTTLPYKRTITIMTRNEVFFLNLNLTGIETLVFVHIIYRRTYR